MKKMYNERVKNIFLSNISIKKLKLAYSEMFYRTGILETELEKDIYEFDFLDFKIFFSTQNTTIITNENYIDFLKRYINFCISKSLCKNDSLMALSKIDLKKDVTHTTRVIELYFKDVDDFADYLEYAYREYDVEQVCMQITAYLLIICGIEGHDVLKLKKEEIRNIHNGILRYGDDKEVELPQKVIDYCNICIDTESYVAQTKYVYYANNDFLIRGRERKNKEQEPLDYTFFTQRGAKLSALMCYYKGEVESWSRKSVKPKYLYENAMFLRWKKIYGKDLSLKKIVEKEKFSVANANTKMQEYFTWLNYFYDETEI